MYVYIENWTKLITENSKEKATLGAVDDSGHRLAVGAAWFIE